MKLLSDKEIKSYIGLFLWETCETFKINAGRFAPIIFGWMVGSKGKRIDNKKP
jgi:hypothetical protein